MGDFPLLHWIVCVLLFYLLYLFSRESISLSQHIYMCLLSLLSLYKLVFFILPLSLIPYIIDLLILAWPVLIQFSFQLFFSLSLLHYLYNKEEIILVNSQIP